MDADIRVHANAAELAEAAANLFVETAARVLAGKPRLAVALSGGTTPAATYARLAMADVAERVNWKRIHFFWGDERCVPPDHADSDFRMARETLLDQIPLPPANIHRMRGELDPQEAAALYEQDLRAFFGDLLPRFDVIWLGLGEDGHTASLFPGTAALHDTAQWAAANWVEKLHSWRLTLTPPVINNAALAVFLVAGPGKAAIVRRVLSGPRQPDDLPAQLIRPTAGQLIWLMDEAAAGSRR
jgi:6-phosphogluconolactonase